MDITPKRLKDLERSEAKLNALESGGVDNWGGYDISLEEYFAKNELGKNRDTLIDELEVVFGQCAYEPSERGAVIAFTEDIRDKVLAVLDDLNVIFK